MSVRLGKSPQVQTLARDLKLDFAPDAVTSISEYCERRVAKLLRDFPNTDTLEKLLTAAAVHFGTIFEAIRSDADLLRVKRKYVDRPRREPGFANLENELSDHIFGVTFRLVHPESWETPFVSVIDCRDDKAAREYFTKWHEVAHLFTLTDQRRLTFYRSHSEQTYKDPEESLADIIAGRIGFYPPIIRPFAIGNLSFDKVQDLHMQLCPTASRQATLIGFVNAWPRPCIYIRAELAFRKADELLLRQDRFQFSKAPIPELRVVTITANDSARSGGNLMRWHWRVPKRSIIYRVYERSEVRAEACEDLSMWESSDGTVLDPCSVSVEAQTSWDAVEALIHLNSSGRGTASSDTGRGH